MLIIKVTLNVGYVQYRLHLSSKGEFITVRIVLMVPLFIYLVNVLLQNRFTWFHLVAKFFTQPAFGVQASCVVDADQDHTSDAITAVSAQLDFITLSMACMVHVYYVLQVTQIKLEYNGQQAVSWSGQTTRSKASPSRMYPARQMGFIYLTREHLQQFVLPGIPYTNKYNTKINVNTNYEYSKTIELNKMIE